MEIDWITVSAQIVNFLILVWLLKRFLYQPVIRAMDRREQRVTERLHEAQQREQTADEQAQRYQDKVKELDRRRDEIVTQANEEAEEEKRRLLNEAREAVAETRRQWQTQAAQEKEEFITNLRRQTAEAVQDIARKVLGDLADRALEEQMVQIFIDKLAALDSDSRQALADTAEPMHVESSFELDSTLRGRLTRAIHEHLAEGIDAEYAQSPDLLCGIELTSGGQRLSWNIADYIEDMAGRIEDAFRQTEPAKEMD